MLSRANRSAVYFSRSLHFAIRLLAFCFGLGHSNVHFMSVYKARLRSNTDTIRCVKIILIDILDNVNGKQSTEPKIEV